MGESIHFSARAGAIALLLALPLSLPAQLVPTAGEFAVNTYTTSSQTEPRIAADAVGNVVVTWKSFDQDGDGWGVFARRYNSSGTALGAEFQVNSVTTAYQEQSSVAFAPNGDFIVTWVDGDVAANVVAKRYDSAGVPQGSEFQVNNMAGYHNLPNAAFDATGGFVIAWTGYDGFYGGIFARRFDSAGAAQGTEFQVNAYTSGGQDLGGIARAAGGFVITWSSFGQDGSSGAVIARRYDSSGVSVGTEFVVNTYTTSGQGSSHISPDASGNFVVVWSGYGDQDGDGFGIFAQRFDNAGLPTGSEFQINSYTTGNQTRPAVGTSPAGDFVVSWQSIDEDGSDYGVFVRAFRSDGTPDGDSIQVNQYTTGFQLLPDIAALSDGKFMVVWASVLQDGSFHGVYGRRFAGAAFPIPGKKLLLRTPSSPTKNKLVFLAKDPGIAPPESLGQDPRCAPLGSGSGSSGARLRVVGAGGDFTIDLPCANWSANSAQTSYRYRDASGNTCNVILIKAGQLQKMICKGPQIAYTLGAPQGDVHVILATGDPATNRKYCATFGPLTSATVVDDGSGGKKYKALAAGPGVCP